jgi:HSP20 family molecular chaperone IbpA
MATPQRAFTSQFSFATAPRFVNKTEAEALDEAIRRRVAERAYQLYESAGYAPGHEREHWLQAESEVLRGGLEVRESGSWVAVNGYFPGVSAEGVEIYVDAQRIVIRAKRQPASQGGGSSADGMAEDTLLGADLPAEVDPATATAALKEGKLTLMVKKRSPSVMQPIQFANQW